MNYVEISDLKLAEAYKDYCADKDYNGSKGIALAEEIERRAGGLEKISTWIKKVTLPESKKKLIDYVHLADQLNLNPNKCSTEGIDEKKKLLYSIGVHGLYMKKLEGMRKAPVCPIEHVPVNVLCSVFNQYYVQGIKTMEEFGLR